MKIHDEHNTLVRVCNIILNLSAFQINKDRQMIKAINEWKPSKPIRPPDWIQSSDYQVIVHAKRFI